jgi:hypothetical protein
MIEHRMENESSRAITPPGPDWDSLDTDMTAVLRAKSPAERLAMAHGMWRSAQSMILRVVRREHPDWPQEKVSQEVARRMSHGSV